MPWKAPLLSLALVMPWPVPALILSFSILAAWNVQDVSTLIAAIGGGIGAAALGIAKGKAWLDDQYDKSFRKKFEDATAKIDEYSRRIEENTRQIEEARKRGEVLEKDRDFWRTLAESLQAKISERDRTIDALTHKVEEIAEDLAGLSVAFLTRKGDMKQRKVQP